MRGISICLPLKHCLSGTKRGSILVASRVKIATCLARYGCVNYVPEEDVADYTIERFEELKGVVKEINDELRHMA